MKSTIGLKHVMRGATLALMLVSSAGFTPTAQAQTCPTPLNPYSSTVYPPVGTLSIFWQVNPGGPSQFELRWRVVGTPDWTAPPPGPVLSNTHYRIENLTANTLYEWQVRGLCSGTPSAWTPLGPATTFRTLACNPAYGLKAGVNELTANVTWVSQVAEGHSLDYRVVGSATWTTVNGITHHLGTGQQNYTIMGLALATQYEVRVKTNCDANNSSAYSEILRFHTDPLPPPVCGKLIDPTVFYSQGLWYPSWGFDPNAIYPNNPTIMIRWRAVGSASWTEEIASGDPKYYFPNVQDFTSYEFQVKAVCSASVESPYSDLYTFPRCGTPPNAQPPDPQYPDQATLRFGGTYVKGGKYDLQWRSLGAATWNTIPNRPQTDDQYTLTGLSPNTDYEYRYRKVCTSTATSDYNVPVTFRIDCQAPPPTSNIIFPITATTAKIEIVNNGVGKTTTLRYRPIGSTTWSMAPNLTANVTITGLTPGTAYEMQARTNCTATDLSPFYESRTFRTQCAPPFLFTPAPGRVTTELRWVDERGEATGFNLRYRPTGSGVWQVVTNLPVLGTPSTFEAYNLTGLTGNTDYEWQVQQVCAANDLSVFSNRRTFRTRNCAMPNFPRNGTITGTTAQLLWASSEGQSSKDARWRPVGATDWITYSGVLGNNFNAASLSSSTSYQWQVRQVCSVQDISPFTSVVPFTTTNTPGCPAMFTVQAGNWNAAATWSCNRVPTATDPVQVRHNVLVPAGVTAVVQRITFDTGVGLTFGLNATLLLNP